MLLAMTYDLCHGGHMVAEYPLLHTPSPFARSFPQETHTPFGRLQWLSCPGVKSAVFPAGAYQQLYMGRRFLTRALARSLATSVICAIPPSHIPQQQHTRAHTMQWGFALEWWGPRDATMLGVVSSPSSSGCHQSTTQQIP